MLALRFYIDRKINPETGHGGEHSRIIDVADMDIAAARELVAKELTEDEEINQVASITIDDPDGHPVLS